jgi:hypothetical protein
MPETKAPTMARSRGQLATIYAPNSLFTFEGGEGACMARPFPNRGYEPASPHTKRLIHEQIVEFMESWLQRATSGQNTVVAVAPERALDRNALRDGAVQLPIGALHFQVPERVGYIPFPTAFTCTRCSLHRSCSEDADLAREASGFRGACPTGRKTCADDWQQLDVVLAHWSGAVEAVTPMRRRAKPGTLAIEKLTTCSTCGGERFYLRRNGATFDRWRFECVDCGTLREIQREDNDTLEALKQDLANGAAVRPQINMEPISYRASATYYAQGDRLLVFGADQFLALLQGDNVGALGRVMATQYGFPPPTLDDSEKERLLRDAGRGKEWDDLVALRDLVRGMESTVPAASLSLLRDQMAKCEAAWNETVFAARAGAPDALALAIGARRAFIRRFDPIRMAVEHRTLMEETLRAGACLADGKQLSTDVTRPDEFMLPDVAVDPERRGSLATQVSRRLGILGIAEMRLVRGLQICEYTFGFTRTSSTPLVRRDKAGAAEMPVRLNLLGRVRVGDSTLHPVLCLEQSNEAFYVRLDEETVMEWLAANRLALATGAGQPRLGGRLIEAYPAIEFSRFLDEYRRERSIPRTVYPFVYSLLHTLSHHLIVVSAAMSGLDLGSFGEHLFVPDLAFLVYRRGMTMDLGNLSSMWRDRGDPVLGNELLDRMVSPESLRCGSESVCTHHGGACPDCILIPETACLTRNELLSRSLLSGRGSPRWDADATPLVGFYETAISRTRRPAPTP